jgi:hypothetical protein
VNTKHLSIRRRRGGWTQFRTRYGAVYVRLGRGPVSGDYEREATVGYLGKTMETSNR